MAKYCSKKHKKKKKKKEKKRKERKKNCPTKGKLKGNMN